MTEGATASVKRGAGWVTDKVHAGVNWARSTARQIGDNRTTQRAIQQLIDPATPLSRKLEIDQQLSRRLDPRQQMQVRALWQGGVADEAAHNSVPRNLAEISTQDKAIFYHGTERKHVPAFEEGGAIKAMGEEGIQDFGSAFYTTRRLKEAIGWAGDRRGGTPGEKFVIAIEVERAKLETLTGRNTNHYEYRLGVTPEEYRKGIKKTAQEISAANLSADYIYGPVSGLDNWEQFAFKSQRALDVINSSPREIYRVLPDGRLVLVKRITP